MKLKYILRGIGIGALITVALMYPLTGKGKTLTDDEIRVKARELGMLTVDEFQERELNSLKDKIPNISEIKISDKKESSTAKGEKLSEIKEDKKKISSKLGKSEKLPKEKKTTEDGETSDKTFRGKPSEVTKGGNTEANSTEDTSKPATKDKAPKFGDTSVKVPQSKPTTPKSSAVTTPKPDTSTKITGDNITITIKSGMSSEKVAELLKSNGIIKDSMDFNKYLVKSGYSSNIRIGSFTFTKGEAYSEISRKLVRK